ncbi:MAG: YraN family protein [Flavobacteriaceae bacterium]
MERSNSNCNLGKIGESKAAQYLVDSGFQILVRNYRWKSYEVDIIAQDKDLLLAVEVKTTAGIKHLKNPFSLSQLKRVSAAFNQFADQQGALKEMRIDGIIYYKKREALVHLKEIFIPGV